MRFRVEVSREGKALLFALISPFLGLVGLALNSPFLMVLAIILFAAGILSLWLMQPGCGGRMNWHETKDGDIHIGICDSCDRWQIYIRESPVAMGRGFKEFQHAMERAIQTNATYLPHLSAQLREVLKHFEEASAPEGGFELERDG
jgi:hypothetical protein